MSATTLFYLLVCLVTGVWALAIISFFYGRSLLKRQKILIEKLLPYLQQIYSERQTIRSLSISDQTPLGDLQNITLPDNIRVDFQHNTPKE